MYTYIVFSWWGRPARKSRSFFALYLTNKSDSPMKINQVGFSFCLETPLDKIGNKKMGGIVTTNL